MNKPASSCCDAPAKSAPGPAIDADELATICKALAHPARVTLLKYLADYGTCYFGKLTDVLPLAPSTISNHVSILKEAGLIEGSSDEQRICYCVNRDRLNYLKHLIDQF
ncbi:ArsR/SmtB family transcription factor [Permianibacter aggregans]|uniref:ArsR family transcriptional regulator n=1 Tax=Permianibacter aggregans TaxID=1510150 RepID=A0A4R6UT93_9GAMM|nr:metalloregulator ArsR/SmtB family transcription factor [Permianibacter aggregans]QGX40385.1 ArsR family transcriptional regulator [Permianibacter aggregans]TDQ49486.1 ArsR family transcriptional regulator [Permianibacter aggregans]